MAIAIGLLKTLLELGRSRKSGVLDAIGPEARVRIFVEEGAIVFADEGLPGDALRELLLREQVLTKEQIDTALEWIEETRRTKGITPRLGEVLVELKLLTPGQLSAARAAQVQEKVVRALGWPNAAVRFFESFGPLEIVPRFATPVEPLVLAALRLVDAAQIEELFAQSLDRYPALRRDDGARKETLERIDALRLRPPEREFVLSLDGTRSVREVLATTAPIDPSLLGAALLLTDCLDLHGSALTPSRRDPLSGQKRSRTPFHGMAPPPKTAFGATQPSPTAPRRASGPPSRPSGVHVQPPEEKAQAKTVTASLRSAQDAKKKARDEEDEPILVEDKPTLPALDAPTPEDTKLPANSVVAEQAYQLARGYVRANRLPQALAELRRAQALHPTPEYALWIAWVELRADAKYDPARIETAKRAAEAALAEDAAFGFGYFVLGHLAFRAGEHAKASELFERANSLEPAALDDVRDVRLRAPQAGQTQGEVKPLAPLLTATPRPMPVGPIREAIAAAAEKVATGPTKPAPAPRIAKTLVSLGSEAPPRAEVKPEPVTDEIRASDFGPARAETSPPPSPLARIALKTVGAPPAPASSRPVSVPPPPSSSKPHVIPTAPPSKPPRPAPPRPDPRPAPPVVDVKTPPAPSSLVETTRSPLAPAGVEEPKVDSEDQRVVIVDTQVARGDDGDAMVAAAQEEGRRVSAEEDEDREIRESFMPPRRRSSATMRAVFAVVILLVAVLIAKQLSGPTMETTVTTTTGPEASIAETETDGGSEAATTVVASSEEDASTTTTSLEVDAGIPEIAEDAAAAPIVELPDAGATVEVVTVEAGGFPPGTGGLDLPPAADGHRVYVDGRMIGVPPAPIVIACGQHVVRIGSAGRDHDVAVPCGARLALPYP